MAAISLLIGGIAGAFFAAAAFLSGFSLFWSLVIYAVVGHLLFGLALMRLLPKLSDNSPEVQAQIDADVLALREMQARLAATKPQAPAILFRALRLQQMMQARVAPRRSPFRSRQDR